MSGTRALQTSVVTKLCKTPGNGLYAYCWQKRFIDKRDTGLSTRNPNCAKRRFPTSFKKGIGRFKSS